VLSGDGSSKKLLWKVWKINQKTSTSRIDFAVSNSIDGVFYVLQQQGTILTYCFDFGWSGRSVAYGESWRFFFFIIIEGGH
jgi:hypothetical protein